MIYLFVEESQNEKMNYLFEKDILIFSKL